MAITFLKPKFSELQACVLIAQNFHRNGGGDASMEQFAKVVGNSAKSSYFTLKVNALKAYGLITTGGDRARLTALGESIVAPKDPSEVTNARINALSTFPLFKALVERYRGKGEPDPGFVANALLTEVKVKTDTAEAWADCFIKSARYVGLFNALSGRPERPLDEPMWPPKPPPSEPPPVEIHLSEEEAKEGWLVYPVRVAGGTARIVVPPSLSHGVWEKLKRLLEAIEPDKQENLKM